MADATLPADVRSAVDTYVKADGFVEDKEGRQAALATVVEALREQKVQLLDLVLYLQAPLNDSGNPAGRKHSVQLLADCLRSPASQLRLNFKHVETFITFFCTKLSDWQCVEGAVIGLTAVLQNHAPVLRTLQGAAGEPLVLVVAKAVFKGVHTPSHTQQVRKAVLEFVRILLGEWKEDLVKLGAELGEGVHGVIEEERDPRNLLLAFALARQLFRDFPASCISEESLQAIFESLTSYFPITFTPPKDDKFGITGSDLKDALNNALGATQRVAKLVVPFLLDSCKDITVGDNENTIADALRMLSFCMERYGPNITRTHLKEVLATARDQVCRTTTPCPAEFAEMVRRVCAVAMHDVPAGLHPAWLSRDLDPACAELAADAAGAEGSLASVGARRLLVAIASAHRVLLERVWGSVGQLLFPPAEKGAAARPMPRSALAFVSDLARAAEGAQPGAKPLLAPRVLKPALASTLAALQELSPGARSAADVEPLSDPQSDTFVAAVRLAELLGRLVGEESSADAFSVLQLLLLPPTTPATDSRTIWATRWRDELVSATVEEPRVEALLQAVAGIVPKQPARAADLAPALLAAASLHSPGPAWLPAALPRLLAAAALSLAVSAAAPATEGGGDEAAPAPSVPATSAGAATEASRLLEAASQLLGSGDAAGTLRVLAEALEASSASAAAASWAAARLVALLGLPAELPRLCAGAAAGDARRFIAVLCLRLPEPDASALRRGVLEVVAQAGALGDASVLVLVPAVMPEGIEQDPALAQRLVDAACRCASASELGGVESLALEALEAIIEACPRAELDALLAKFKDTFSAELHGQAGRPRPDPQASRAAARCWAATAVALLRRGGFAAQADAFVKVLVDALEDEDAPMVSFVPLAFQVMLPPNFDVGVRDQAQAKLPPLALQQLSMTLLPRLLEIAKRGAVFTNGATSAGMSLPRAARAALESAVSLLCALPVEALFADCDEELRWCTLTGLKCLQDSVEPVFAAQVVQLLARAARRSPPWVEDDLSSLVQPILGACASHRVPLVRLGCLQALQQLVMHCQGHMLPFKKQIESATRKAIEDRRREVRLSAVSCLNAWHCMLTAERD